MKIYSMAAATIMLAGLTGCINISGWRTVNGSGQIVTETRKVSDFNQVSVSGSGELVVTQGSEESLVIETDDNFLPLIRSEVVDGRLSIGPRNVNLRPTKAIHYQLKLKNLNALHLSGSLQAQANPIQTDRLGLHISGSGKIRLARLTTKALEIQISGSGDTVLAGEATEQRIHISGSGDHHAGDLKSAQAEVSISGSGHATIWVGDNLTTHISGSGTVEYYGAPKVSSHTSGSGRVTNLGNKASTL